jgi:hypothetical protein
MSGSAVRQGVLFAVLLNIPSIFQNVVRCGSFFTSQILLTVEQDQGIRFQGTGVRLLLVDAWLSFCLEVWSRDIHIIMFIEFVVFAHQI